MGEPELDKWIVTTAFQASRAQCSNVTTGYMLHLAKELAVRASSGAAWDEVLRLAFRYLDADRDGLLSAEDLAANLTNPEADMGIKAARLSYADALTMARVWVARRRSAPRGLRFVDFRSALNPQGAQFQSVQLFQRDNDTSRVESLSGRCHLVPENLNPCVSFRRAL